jgi:hypothetical protein
MDTEQLLALRARESHSRTRELAAERTREKVQRDEAIILLHRSYGWSYGRIARAVQCSPELVAAVVNPPKKKPRKSSETGLTDLRAG